MNQGRLQEDMTFDQKVQILCNGHKPAEEILRKICCKGRKIDETPLHTLDEMGFYEHFIEVLHDKCCPNDAENDAVKEFDRFLYLRHINKITDEEILGLLAGEDPIDPGLIAWEDAVISPR